LSADLPEDFALGTLLSLIPAKDCLFSPWGRSALRARKILTIPFFPLDSQNQTRIYHHGIPGFLDSTHSLFNNHRTLLPGWCVVKKSLYSTTNLSFKNKCGFARLGRHISVFPGSFWAILVPPPHYGGGLPAF
jgi:hypothetical protein